MKLVVQKFNPLTDSEPHFVEGEVEYHDGITALDALYLFHTAIEPVNFDYSCGGRICGRCTAMVDGEPALMCMAVLDDGEHTIAPLEGFPVINDLIVEKTAFERNMTGIARRVMIEDVNKETFVPEDFTYDKEAQKLMHDGELCCRCGVCMAACPVLKILPDEYVGPAEMFQVGYRHFDYYDKADRIAQAVSEGMYHCTQCGTCDSVCVREVDHATMWKRLRAEAEKRNLVPSYAK